MLLFGSSVMWFSLFGFWLMFHCEVLWLVDTDAILGRKTSLMSCQRACKPSSNPPRNEGLKKYKSKNLITINKCHSKVRCVPYKQINCCQGQARRPKLLVVSPLREEVCVLWRESHILIPPRACWFTRTPCTW